MSIIKIKKRTTPFVQMDKTGLEDTRMSLSAKGLLSYLLSRPDNWKVCVSHLTTIGPERRDAIYSALKELRESGYVEKIEERDDLGMVKSTDYIVSELPASALPAYAQADSGESDTNNKDRNKIEEENNILPEPKVPAQRMESLLVALIKLEGLCRTDMVTQDYNRIRAGVKKIHAATPDVTPEEIERRAKNYSVEWPNMTFTTGALAKHWARFGATEADYAKAKREAWIKEQNELARRY